MTPASNFLFLEKHEPLLARFGMLAERYFADDPNTSLIKLRQFGEVLCQVAAASLGIYVSNKEKQHVLLDRLYRRGVLPQNVSQLLHSLRKAGNDAVHGYKDKHGQALHQLKAARKLGIWFYESICGERAYKPGPFVPPSATLDQSSIAEEMAQLREALEASRSEAERARLAVEEEARKRLSAEEQAKQEAEEREVWEALATDLEAQNERRLQQRQAEAEALEARGSVEEMAQRMHTDVELTEAETRYLIDEELAAAGWEVNSQHMRYATGTRPQKGRTMAIAEWPVDGGRADYALFVGLRLLALVEAKRFSTDVSAALEQSKRYSRDYQNKGDEVLAGGPWGEYKVPFLFATNGRPFLRQLRTKSGIWFLDVRRAENRSRPLVGWYSPQGLLALLSQDPEKAHERLAAEPFDYLGLRDYQVEAVQSLEAAIGRGQRSCLLAMATGTGKTRTCIGFVYRLLKAQRFKRILFLVDRTALGEQATNAFKDARLEGLRTFTEIYDVKELQDAHPEPETKLQIATVQGLVKRLLYPNPEAAIMPVDLYDCIVVDESHRGYTLDRELGESELDFRDQTLFLSKYRRVLDYFDAVKIGLTATPALHTKEIFGSPVYEYGYRQAVVDGWLIDHEAPYQFNTKLSEEGISWEAGEEVVLYQPRTQHLETATLEDEVQIEIEGFNKQVVVESFNRTICQLLAAYLDPTSLAKTLIFCVTDAHADMVVDLMKEALAREHGSVEEDAVIKITGSADRPNELIRRFRNERLPNIVVTVDLLTTGIDVPEIANLVFLRRVRSRILYEQMIGRATRLCPKIDKEFFRIFDAVQLYRDLDFVSTMKPVITNPKVSFAQMAAEMAELAGQEAGQTVKEQFLAKLQRKKRRLDNAPTSEQHALFEAAAQISLDDFVTQAYAQSPRDLASWLETHPDVCAVLEQPVRRDRSLYVSEHEDEARATTRGYGEGERPQDYLDSFERFIQDNMNELPALLTVLQRPSDLTRRALKELKLKLDLAGYAEGRVQQAWKQSTDQDIAASIVGFIRQLALKKDATLLPYHERVQAALDGLLANQDWTHEQRKWLRRIGKQMQEEIVVDREALDTGEFKRQAGGFNRLNKLFEGRLMEVVGAFNDAVWRDNLG